jgi:uncharacterized delta-60 repeat protein
MRFRATRRARRAPSACPRPFRPQVEALEDRCLLSAGDLDPTFGNGAGYVTTSLSRGNDTANAVLIQPWDGKIVVVGSSGGGDMSLTRYNTDGTLDTSFGSGGEVVSRIGTTWWNAAALYASTDTTGNAKKVVEAGAGSLARFNPNGTTDTSFGRRGLVAVPWTIAGVVIQPADGKVVVAGDNGSGFEVSRYNPDGTLDPTFGSGGTATLSEPAGVSANALGLQADGKLVVAGAYGPGYGTEWELARFTSSGSLDNSTNDPLSPFGGGTGFVTTTFAAGSGPLRGLAIYPSTGSDTADYGKIEAVGTISGNPGGVNGSQVALARFDADGTADGTFGQSGQVVTPFPGGGGMAWATSLQADGKVVVAGQTLPGAGSHWAFSLLRYNTDGSLDTSFGNGGLAATPSGTGDSKAWGVAVQADGRIVAAGGSQGGTGFDFMVARYLASGPHVGSFMASPNPVTSGSTTTLTGLNISDGNPGAAVAQVGYGPQASGVWTLTNPVSLAAGPYTRYAQALDSDGVLGDLFATPRRVI